MNSSQEMTEVQISKGVTDKVVGDQVTEIFEEIDPVKMDALPLEQWDYQRPKRGEIRTGVILAIQDQEIIVDVDAKRDGIVPYADMQRLGDEEVEKLSVGEEISVYILKPEDKEGNLLVSIYQARKMQSWEHAAELAESGKVWEGEVTGYNKGGLLMPVEEIRGFIPASQVPGFPQGLNHEERLKRLSSMVGDKLIVKIIEINRRNRRLILSATAARRQWRKRQRERLLEELREGEVRKGTVSSLASFGAFVDLGGADGLIHISELSWRRVRHPRDVLSVGDEIEVYVLRLDHERNRIGLSLKRLQPEPWSQVDEKYELGQLVEGVVTNVVDFGAFAEIEPGVEGLIHVSELADGPVSHPREVVRKGDLLLLRIIRIDVRRKRLGLSLKRVLESEWAEWAARLAEEEAKKKAEEAPQAETVSEEPSEEAEEEAGTPEAEAEAKEEEAAAPGPEVEGPAEETTETEEASEEPESPIADAEAEAEAEAPVAEAEEPSEEAGKAEEAEATEEPSPPGAEAPTAEADVEPEEAEELPASQEDESEDDESEAAEESIEEPELATVPAQVR